MDGKLPLGSFKVDTNGNDQSFCKAAFTTETVSRILNHTILKYRKKYNHSTSINGGMIIFFLI